MLPHLKSAGRLHGLAKMTLSCGTLCAAAHLSSCTLAQSKPAPSAFSMATCGKQEVNTKQSSAKDQHMPKAKQPTSKRQWRHSC